MKKYLASAALAAALSLAAGASQAAVVTFEGQSIANPVANGYGGLNWNNFYTLNQSYHPGSGYDHGAVSPTNVAYNAFGYGASFDAGGASFLFGGAYFTAAWTDGLQLQIKGFNGANELFSQTLTLNTASPYLFAANWAGVTSVTFNAYGNGQTHFAMDNVTIDQRVSAVPEPATWAMMIAGFGAVGAMARSNRRRQVIA
jgi:hypothetical protein